MAQVTKIQDVLVQTEDRVSLITLNTPEKRNSLSPGIMGGLVTALRNADADDEVRCVVITGADPAFCSGGDVRGFVNKYETGVRPPWVAMGKEIHYGAPLRAMSKPVIAAVNGPATGAGFQMALMCDIRIASERARFSGRWIKVALDAAGGGCYFLPRSIGLSNTFWMIYTGEFIDAQKALEWHLVTEVVPHEQIVSHTMELAKQIAKHPPIPLSMNRRVTYRALDTPYETIAEWQHAQRLICYHTEDHHEAAQSFLEKREPNYKGK